MKVVKISDIFNNPLFEIKGEEVFSKELYENTAMLCNPPEVPVKPVYRDGLTSAELKKYIKLENPEEPKYKDGLKETAETYADIGGRLLLFGDEVADNPYFTESTEISGKYVFSGSKYYDWGLVFLTDKRKNGCFTAVYERVSGVLYTLGEGYELSKPDLNGDIILFSREKAYQASLLIRAEIMMCSFYPMLIEDEKIYAPAAAKKENGIIKVPAAAVFGQLYCEVEADGEKAVITKQSSVLELSAGEEKAYIDGREYMLKAPVSSENGIILAEAEIVKAFLGITVIYDEKLNKIRFVAEKEYYKKWKIEENTYMMMPFYSEEDFPVYIKEEGDETAKRIKAMGDGIVNVAFMTDMHYGAFDNDRMIVKKAVNAYKYIADKVPAEGIIIGGDSVNEGTKEIRTEIFKELTAHFEGTDAFFIKGNHDDGSIWDCAFEKSAPAVNHFTGGELKSLMFSCLPGRAVTDEGNPDGAYWYFDNAEKKIRFIGLDSSELEHEVDEEGKLKFPGIYYSRISDEQFKWLGNEALSFKEEGWTALIFLHVGLTPCDDEEAVIKKNRTTYPLAPMLDAYKRKEKFQKSFSFACGFENNLDFDFTGYKTAEIAGVICGHYHKDNGFCSCEGIPYVRTAAFCPENFGKYTAGMIRKERTKEEILFDMISVDTKRKKLYFTRVGAGEDREFDY